MNAQISRSIRNAPNRCRILTLASCLLVLAYASLWIDAPPLARSQETEEDFLKLAASIDRHLAKRWTAMKVTPAAPADDAEFLRRVFIDLAGRIPSVAEARAFLKEQSPAKRQRLVNRLLDNPRYVAHFTNLWRQLLLPEGNSNIQVRPLVPGFESWLQQKLAKNAGYDDMVRDLLTAPLDRQPSSRPTPGEASSVAFFLAKEVKAENLASAVSRLFLGLQLECAQCHNHPYGDWKREQFWGLAAFFAGIKGRYQDNFITLDKEQLDIREILVPGTGKVVPAGFLDGVAPKWKSKDSPRKTLADWLTSPRNPYFARAIVNRMWAYFFGTGLMEPVDDMDGSNQPASHPDLLDELARDFAEHRFDLKYLMRAITASRAYQLSSAGTSRLPDGPPLFSRMQVRGMSPEQILDNVLQATGYPEDDQRLAVFGKSLKAEFLTTFADQSKATEASTSIPQALLLLNGKLVAHATSLGKNGTLAAVVDAPSLNTAQRIETLYLATLSRLPNQRELRRLTAFVEKHSDKERKNALADVFWALLNSSEFMLNH